MAEKSAANSTALEGILFDGRDTPSTSASGSRAYRRSAQGLATAKDLVGDRSAGVAQWQSSSLPSWLCGFDSHHPLQPHAVPTGDTHQPPARPCPPFSD